MRRKLVAGNWKMNGMRAALPQVEAIAAAAAAHPGVDAALCVPATLIAPAVAVAGAMPVGGQDCHASDSGAHTGCIAAPMLVEAGARLTLVGHSERRADQGEGDADVKAKAEAGRRHGLNVILCVGETLEERDAGRAEAVVTAQIAGSLPDGADGDWLAIAYEPVWAIGTGKTATPEMAADAHRAIRSLVTAKFGAAAAQQVRILYGGSVKPDNVKGLMAQPEIDGALVGGASLEPASFASIVNF